MVVMQPGGIVPEVDIGLHPVSATLLALLGNQRERTAAAFDHLRDDVFIATPGHDCKSIQEITRHLIDLRRFQLTLLGQDETAKQIPDSSAYDDRTALLNVLEDAAVRVHSAITMHDGEDWFVRPATPRRGKWGDEPTLHRVIRPLNDFSNHLGAVRAIRRLLGHPADRTQ